MRPFASVIGAGPDGAAAPPPLGAAAGLRVAFAGAAGAFFVVFFVVFWLVFFGVGFGVGVGVGVGLFGASASRRLPRLHFQFSIVVSGSTPFLHSSAAAPDAGAARTRTSAPAETAADADPIRLIRWRMPPSARCRDGTPSVPDPC